jgi:hypothetical protein
MDKIYKVTTEGDCEGRSTSTLGYCTGNPSDIKAYFNDRKTYEIRLEELKVVHISPTSASERVDLIKKKQQLQKEIDNINEKL